MISRSTQNIQARIINTYNLPFQALLTQPQSLISLLLASTLKFFSGSSYLPPKSPAGFEMQMKLPLGKGHLICDDGKGQGHFFGLETHSSVSGHKYFSHWLSSTFCSYEAGSSDPWWNWFWKKSNMLADTMFARMNTKRGLRRIGCIGMVKLLMSRVGTWQLGDFGLPRLRVFRAGMGAKWLLLEKLGTSRRVLRRTL